MSVHVDQDGREDEDESTRIKVSGPVADELHDLKDRGQSYDSVIRQLLAEHQEQEGDR